MCLGIGKNFQLVLQQTPCAILLPFILNFFEMTDLQVTWLRLWVCLQYIFRFGKRRYLVWNDTIISLWNHQSVLEGHFIRHVPIFCSFDKRTYSKRLGFFFCGFFFFYLCLPTCDYIIPFESIAYKLCCSYFFGKCSSGYLYNYVTKVTL